METTVHSTSSGVRLQAREVEIAHVSAASLVALVNNSLICCEAAYFMSIE